MKQNLKNLRGSNQPQIFKGTILEQLLLKEKVYQYHITCCEQLEEIQKAGKEEYSKKRV